MDNISHFSDEFRYRLLSRLQADCDYYLGHGNRHKKDLWAGDETKQIELMIELHNSFEKDKKPEWLTMDDISNYQEKMNSANTDTNKYAFIKVGKTVYWHDPEDITNGMYEVVSVPDEIEDDSIILIASDYSEAEVFPTELSPAYCRTKNRKKSLTQKKID